MCGRPYRDYDVIDFFCLTILACLGRNFDHGLGHKAATIPGMISDKIPSRTSYCCGCKLGQDLGQSWMQTWKRPQRVMIFARFLIYKMKTLLSAQIWISKKSHVYFTKFQRHPMILISALFPWFQCFCPLAWATEHIILWQTLAEAALTKH